MRERLAVVEMDALMAREELFREKAGKGEEVAEAAERFHRKEKDLKKELRHTESKLQHAKEEVDRLEGDLEQVRCQQQGGRDMPSCIQLTH